MPRTHFNRFLTPDQIAELQALLEGVSGRRLRIDWRAPTFEIRAPDGDVVLAGLKHSSGAYIVRLHREVFSRNE
jgi:hypothetical protein